MTGGTINISGATTTLRNVSRGCADWTNNKASLTMSSPTSMFDLSSGTTVIVDALNGYGEITGSGSLTIGINSGSGTWTGSIMNTGVVNVTKAGTGIEVFKSQQRLFVHRHHDD